MKDLKGERPADSSCSQFTCENLCQSVAKIDPFEFSDSGGGLLTTHDALRKVSRWVDIS